MWLFPPQGLAHHVGLFVYRQLVSGVVVLIPGLAHHSGLLLFHQVVSGVVIPTTRTCSPFCPPCVPSGCKWCCYFNHKAWLTILASVCHQEVSGVVISTTSTGSPFCPLCVPSVCKCCCYFNKKVWLTILASLCAISM